MIRLAKTGAGMVLATFLVLGIVLVFDSAREQDAAGECRLDVAKEPGSGPESGTGRGQLSPATSELPAEEAARRFARPDPNRGQTAQPQGAALDASGRDQTSLGRPPAKRGLSGTTVWNITDARGQIPHVLALDEAVVRDHTGRERSVALDPPAAENTLPARLATLGQAGSVFPVLYPRDQPRSLATRRLVTNGLRVQTTGNPAAIAATAGLQLVATPAYAPGFAVLEASDPLSALAAVDRLRALPGVADASVLLASQKQRRALPADPLLSKQWHLKYQNQPGAVSGTDINVESVWNYPAATGTRGNGIRIGIIDDGLQTNHPDLTSNTDTANDHDWNDASPDDPSPPTGQGTGSGDDHGTSCAGNAAARGNNNIGVSGSAPEATLVGLRLVAASESDAQDAAAFAWKKSLIEIKSNSWGPYDDGVTLEAPGPLAAAALLDAVQTGRGGKGTIFVWAGGNGGDLGDNSNYDGFANSPYTIAVAACDSQSRQAYYGEPGANLIVTAPSAGNSPALEITTVDRTGVDGYNSGATRGELSDANYTQTFGGTSSATPTVAGVIALILQANPNLGWRDVQEILLRSAKKLNPADTGWSNNPAGFHFNHKFGAGLIDAAAAVALATTWTNLGPRTSASRSSTVTTSIPDNNATGVSRTFDLTGSNIRVEHVTVTLTVTNVPKGQLDITLTSPGGMVSQLGSTHSDTSNRFSSWTFLTVRDWGENSEGTWTLKVADRKTGTTGSLTAASLQVFGTSAATNPPPVVQITSPADASDFSPGTFVPVTVNASDTTATGTAGTVAQVELLDNGAVVEIDTAAPWTFSFSPDPGDHALTARATDSEGASSVSATVNLRVVSLPTIPGFEEWIAGFTSLTDKTAAADPDGDGLGNLVEYYLGRHPGTAETTVAFTPGRNGDSLTLVYRRSKSTTGVNATAEWSPDLAGVATWSPANVQTRVLEDNANDQLLEASVTIDSAVSRKFLRLRVALAP